MGDNGKDALLQIDLLLRLTADRYSQESHTAECDSDPGV